jgi:hypothetical protein
VYSHEDRMEAVMQFTDNRTALRMSQAAVAVRSGLPPS